MKNLEDINITVILINREHSGSYKWNELRSELGLLINIYWAKTVLGAYVGFFSITNTISLQIEKAAFVISIL